MPISQIHIASESTNINCKAIRASALAFFVLSISFAATAAMAAGSSADANARYQTDRAACMSGQSNQDRETCLKEAGAALEESKTGRLIGHQGSENQNALIRCNALPPGDRDACRRRIEGEGTTSGSVSQGGIVRELVVPDSK